MHPRHFLSTAFTRQRGQRASATPIGKSAKGTQRAGVPIQALAIIVALCLGLALLSANSPLIGASAAVAAIGGVLALTLTRRSKSRMSHLWLIALVPTVHLAVPAAPWPLPVLFVGALISVLEIYSSRRRIRLGPLDWKRLRALITMGLVVGAPLGLLAVGIAATTHTAWVATHGLYSSTAVRIAFPVAAVLNAGAEEYVWRYALLDRLLASGLPVAAASLLQATSFAIPHWSGLPPGTLGVVASLAFGLIVGGLTIRTRSIVPAVTAHALVDFALFWYALSHGLFSGISAGG
jgi:membrane protease YdiL (CAAX protease family)